jgi:hypothetical protein
MGTVVALNHRRGRGIVQAFQQEALHMTDADDVIALAAPATDEQQMFCGSTPEEMSDEALAILVRDGIKKFAKLVPYIIELRKRFASRPRGHADIMGFKTWTAFCDEVLDRTPAAVTAAVRKYLAERPARTAAVRRTLLESLERIAPLARLDSGESYVRFSASEDGHLWLRGYKHGRVVADDVVEDYNTEGYFSTSIPEHQSGLISLSPTGDKPDFCINVMFGGFLSTLKKSEGNPLIMFYSKKTVVHFAWGRNSHGISSELYIAPSDNRVFSDKDLQSAVVWKASKEARAEIDDGAFERAKELVSQIPAEYHAGGYITGKTINLDLKKITLEQLEGIVEILKPARGR